MRVLVQESKGADTQKEAIKSVVACACMTRAANIANAGLEDKEIFLTRAHAKVQKGAMTLPAAS